MKDIFPAHKIHAILDALKSEISGNRPEYTVNMDESRQTLRDYFRFGGADPRTIYKSFFLSYVERYTLPNLIKNYYTLKGLDKLGILKGSKRILDLGCGPGTFSLAYALWSEDKRVGKKDPVSITMVDAVKEFSQVFEGLWRKLSFTRKANIKTKFVLKFIDGSYFISLQSPDLVILSNSVSEILRNPDIRSDSFISDLVSSGAIIVVIDYDYSECFPYLKSFSNKLKDSFTCFQISDRKVRHRFYEDVDLGNLGQICHDLIGHYNTKDGNLRFLKSVWVPKGSKVWDDPSLASNLVAKYKKAWETHDTSVLKAIFTSDAVYWEKKRSEPFHGIDKICKYWEHNANTQSKVHFHPQRISFADHHLTTDWQCKFYRIDLKLWLTLLGSFYVRTRNHRISYFTEEFKKKFLKVK